MAFIFHRLGVAMLVFFIADHCVILIAALTGNGSAAVSVLSNLLFDITTWFGYSIVFELVITTVDNAQMAATITVDSAASALRRHTTNGLRIGLGGCAIGSNVLQATTNSTVWTVLFTMPLAIISICVVVVIGASLHQVPRHVAFL